MKAKKPYVLYVIIPKNFLHMRQMTAAPTKCHSTAAVPVPSKGKFYLGDASCGAGGISRARHPQAVGCGLRVLAVLPPSCWGGAGSTLCLSFPIPTDLAGETIPLLSGIWSISRAKADTGSTGAPFGIMLIRSPAR